jgi:hypothetical protein
MSEFQVHYRVSELLKLLGYVLNKRKVQITNINVLICCTIKILKLILKLSDYEKSRLDLF